MSVGSSWSFSGTPFGVGTSPDANFVLTSTHGSSGQVQIEDLASHSDSTITIGSADEPMGLAVSPMFDRPLSSSPAGYEGDENPSLAASSSIDLNDGVDTETGAYVLDLDGLSLPDIGPSLDMTETYDSAESSTNGPLGYGWSFSYGMSLSQIAYGDPGQCDITVTQENGTPATFTPGTVGGSCPTSGYRAPSFEQASLSHVTDCVGTDSCWVMTRDGTTAYWFDATTGDLVFVKDPNGNTVTLAYSSGKLSSVTGESGYRYLDFTWSGSDISEVTDSAVDRELRLQLRQPRQHHPLGLERHRRPPVWPRVGVLVFLPPADGLVEP